MKSTNSLALLLVLVPSVSGIAQSPLLRDFSPPETISVGDVSVIEVPAGASTESIQGLLTQAINQSGEGGTVRLQFASGAEYRVEGAEGEAVLKLGKTKAGRTPVNLEVDGRGCTFVVTSWSRFMQIEQAKNVVLRDFRLTYDPKNITQGVISRIVDESKGIYEITIDESYPFPDSPRFRDAQYQWVIVMQQQPDGSWGMKPGCPTTITFKWPNSPMHVGGRRFHVRLHTSMDHGRLHGAYEDDPLRKVIEVNDRVALLSRTDGRGGFYATRCHTLVYRDIEIDHSPGCLFADQFSERTCYIGIVARPAGNDLFTSTADGIFTTNQRNGPWIEGCHLEGIGDDAVVLKNNVGVYKGASQDPSRPYCIGSQKAWFSILPGDRLAVYDMSRRRLVSEHEVTSVSSTFPWGDKNVALDRAMSLDEGNQNVWIYNLSNQCNGFVLRNNTFRDHRRWGVLCSGADGSILSNHFERSQNSAVYLVNSDNYFSNKSGAAARNIEIVGNRFDGCWHAENAQPFGVIAARMNGRIEVTRQRREVAGDRGDWNGIQNISIEDNVFARWNATARVPVASRSSRLAEYPVHAIYLQDVADVRICGNVFLPCSNIPLETRAIKLDDFANVRIENNSFRNWPDAGQPISQTAEPGSQIERSAGAH